MVETPHREIGQGTDRLAGHAERLIAQGFKGAAQELVVEIGGRGDDSAIVVIHRQMNPADLVAPPCPTTPARPTLRRRGNTLLRTLRLADPATRFPSPPFVPASSFSGSRPGVA